MRLIAPLLAAALLSSSPGGAAPAVEAGQIGPVRGTSVDPGQITTMGPPPVSAPQIPPPAEGTGVAAGAKGAERPRSVVVAPVRGQDRCDPATRGQSRPVDCDAILDRRAADFGTGTSQPVPADPNRSAAGLVDDVVNGGTGTVVTLPPPR